MTVVTIVWMAIALWSFGFVLFAVNVVLAATSTYPNVRKHIIIDTAKLFLSWPYHMCNAALAGGFVPLVHQILTQYMAQQDLEMASKFSKEPAPKNAPRLVVWSTRTRSCFVITDGENTEALIEASLTDPRYSTVTTVATECVTLGDFKRWARKEHLYMSKDQVEKTVDLLAQKKNPSNYAIYAKLCRVLGYVQGLTDA